jgi:hypothetical protein
VNRHVSFRLHTALTVVALAVAGGSGCSSGDTAPPVATIQFRTNKTRVPRGSPIEFTYRFDVAAKASFNGDY